MREVLDDLFVWWEQGRPVAMGTVVACFRSAPRPPGTAMLVGADGEAVGSVSGGCVEGAVYDLGQEVLQSGIPQLERYGVSDSDAFAVGLTCGGILDVFVERVDRNSYPDLGEVVSDIRDGPARVGHRLIVRSRDEQRAGTLGSAHTEDAIMDDARGLLAHGRSATLEYGPDGERRGEGIRVFVSSHAPPPRMLVFGAIDFAAAVAKIGAFLDYRVTVCDARPVFATASRFPGADEVVARWPHEYLAEEIEGGRIDERTVVCILTHDPKFDVPVLQVALSGPPLAFVGAMGSRRTHEDRLERLREAGVPDEKITRLCSPIGLDLGARTAEQTAISIAAEIIALRWGGTGERLANTEGPIHHYGLSNDVPP